MKKKFNLKIIKIAIIGLGYVGLPLALKIAKQRVCLLTKRKIKRLVFGYDINKNRIKELGKGLDKNKEFTKKQIKNIK